MDRKVLQHCLRDYDAWEREQDRLDQQFFNGQFTKYEYVYASMELLAHNIPAKENFAAVREPMYSSFGGQK